MSLSVSASGMNVADFNLSSTSHNLANASTDNFHAQRVVNAENRGVNETGAGSHVASLNRVEQTGIDYSQELTSLKENSTLYRANAKVMETENKTMGSLLDTMA